MVDNRGRGSKEDESRIERNSSRPYENKQGGGGIKDTRDDTSKKVNDILKKK
jgi:hypothetical protein